MILFSSIYGHKICEFYWYELLPNEFASQLLQRQHTL
jgi:hypothetical protein